jgi:hypothetical protein
VGHSHRHVGGLVSGRNTGDMEGMTGAEVSLSIEGDGDGRLLGSSAGGLVSGRNTGDMEGMTGAEVSLSVGGAGDG